jgi:hypothetical protein
MTPLAHMVSRLRAAAPIDEPYPHYVLDDVLPRDYYDALLAQLPDSGVYENLYEVTDLKLDHFRHRDQRDFSSGWTASLPAAQRDFWDAFHGWFLGPDLARAALASFGIDFSGEVSVESQLIRHRAGYFLGPHSDANTKLVVLLLYLAPDESATELGTSVYRPKREGFGCPDSKHYPFEDFVRVKTAPYRPNSLLAFRRSDRSFHGVEPLRDDRPRDLIQYVVYDKAARVAQLERRKRRRIVFVCRELIGEAQRAADAIASLDNVELTVAHDTHDITSAHLVVTATELLLEDVALANERLGISAMSVDTVRRALDKRSLKRTLREAGLPVAGEANGPCIVKPLRGGGAVGTHRASRASSGDDVLAEELLDGDEVSIDTITIDNEPRFHSVCCYHPSILEALENPSVQWTCILPRDLAPFADFIEQGLRAVRALEVGNAMTHMEGFLRDGRLLGFTDATLRPAGARIAPMLAYAYIQEPSPRVRGEGGAPAPGEGPPPAAPIAFDPYRAWARAVVDGAFDGPWERKYAVGTIFLRGDGRGTIAQLHGIDAVRERLASMIVEARLPRVGASAAATYTGDGFITVRHAETAAVEEALAFIAATVRVETSGGSMQQIDYRPAWDAIPAERGEP